MIFVAESSQSIPLSWSSISMPEHGPGHRRFNATVILDAVEAYVRHLQGDRKMFVTLAGAMSTQVGTLSGRNLRKSVDATMRADLVSSLRVRMAQTLTRQASVLSFAALLGRQTRRYHLLNPGPPDKGSEESAFCSQSVLKSRDEVKK
jgi:hypothetical protein